MKTTIRFSIALLISMSLFQSCLKEQYSNIVQDSDSLLYDYSNFDFSTIQELDLTIRVLNANNSPITGANLEIFVSNPFDSAGQRVKDYANKLMFSGNSGADGTISCKINPPLTSDSIYIESNYVGLPSLTIVPISGSSLNVTIGGSGVRLKSASLANGIKSFTSDAALAAPVPAKVNGYYVLGTWGTSGVPNYLESSNDIISNDLLTSINASLPEYISLVKSHPQYLATANEVNIKLKEDAEVWITFVHEGAGWTNSLGYYTYTDSNPVLTKQDITDMTMIYPNVSFLNSGGGLVSGNKVKLYYFNKQTNTYSSVFPKGVTVCWFLVSQGWNSSLRTVGNGVYTLNSNHLFNPEATEDLQKHNVTLYYEKQNILLLGFEDVRRDQGSDNDFNDAVFYASVSPVTAVDYSKYQVSDIPVDSDKDGVSDQFDQYPGDASKAYNNYYPSQNQFGSLVFEDLWPYKGDYDFNDLVVNYNFNPITNSKNEVVQIEAKFVTRAIGASYHNAFGLSLPTTPANITAVKGQRNTKNYLDIASNGTENGQSKATVILFDDAYNALAYPGTGLCVNTYANSPFVAPDTQKITITLKTPVAISSFGTPPYNPFIIIDRKRGEEVHLPNQKPTDLADSKFLGTGQDRSIPGLNKYYVSDFYLPWALNLPVSFDYPSEKQDITKAYLKFKNWATSQGTLNKDWYLNLNDYRDNSLIYSK